MAKSKNIFNCFTSIFISFLNFPTLVTRVN